MPGAFGQADALGAGSNTAEQLCCPHARASEPQYTFGADVQCRRGCDDVSWVGAIPDVVVCVRLLMAPGLLATYLGGLRGVTAWATAPGYVGQGSEWSLG